MSKFSLHLFQFTPYKSLIYKCIYNNGYFTVNVEEGFLPYKELRQISKEVMQGIDEKANNLSKNKIYQRKKSQEPMFKLDKDYLYSLILPIISRMKRKYSGLKAVEIELAKDSNNERYWLLDIS